MLLRGSCLLISWPHLTWIITKALLWNNQSPSCNHAFICYWVSNRSRRWGYNGQQDKDPILSRVDEATHFMPPSVRPGDKVHNCRDHSESPLWPLLSPIANTQTEASSLESNVILHHWGLHFDQPPVKIRHTVFDVCEAHISQDVLAQGSWWLNTQLPIHRGYSLLAEAL